MRVFCDTSVLVAASVRAHPHFNRARPILEAVASGRDEGVVACHSLAEAYSALTSLPLSPRLQPLEAERLIDVNVRAHFRLQPVPAAAYGAAIRGCVALSLGGGAVYDALLVECARRARCDRIYTFNLTDFRRIAPDLAKRIVAP